MRLINRLGGTGENFTDTVFDDEATTPIASGTPPWTGSFQPDQPLSAIDGIPANGTWTLEVSDNANVDTGTLTAWEIQFEFPDVCPTVGQVNLDKDSYQCNETVQIHVVDFSIVGAGTQSVSIASTTEGAGETVVLNETLELGSFTGSIMLTASALRPETDSFRSRTGLDHRHLHRRGRRVRRTQHSENGHRHRRLRRPAISNVQAINVTGRAATSPGPRTRDRFGRVLRTTAPPLSTVSSAALVTGHSHLSGLVPCTTYSSTSSPRTRRTTTRSPTTAGCTSASDPRGNQPTFNSGAAVPIPDNTAAGATASIVVGDVKELLDVNVLVTVTHPNVGDLELYLIAPDATQIPLSLRRGGTGDNFTNTLFDDGAAASISTGTAPFTGSFKPESPLSALNGILSNGTWSLKAKDLSTGTRGRSAHGSCS